ncbi:MAG: tRNA (adenosine(37)-N6)-dimethylallyltransferase MiaA [Bryobacteraceae bacterium]
MASPVQPILSRPMLVVLGPTGSGKSALAMELAARCSGEIVNCDSLQLYRGFDIGTAKTPLADRRGIPHHLFDVVAPQMSYSAGEYAREARQILAGITGRGAVPVVVGGTGFYLRALLNGLPALPDRDEDLRARLMSREQKRPGSLHKILRRLDPKSAAAIHANDIQKVTRALEIRLLTNAPRQATGPAEPLIGHALLKIGLDPERAALNERLDQRVIEMFANGLLDEVRGLLAGGLTGEEKPFESLGYKQAIACLRGSMTMEEAIASTQLQTRQYAKRQRTWFRREPDVCWMEAFGDAASTITEAVAVQEEFLKTLGKNNRAVGPAKTDG